MTMVRTDTTDVSTLELANVEFARFYRTAIDKGFLYEIPRSSGVAGAHLDRDGRRLVNFASISFMGFQEDETVMDYFCQSSREYGLVTGGSRATQGVTSAHADLESLMNRVTGKEYTLTFASGALANIGFLNAMTTRFGFDEDCTIDNRDAVVVLDHDCHWSLWKGASHLTMRKNLFSYRHNDPKHLDTVLSGLSGAKKTVVLESVYSSDGSVAPLEATLDVCEKHQALSFVDDANGFMIYGTPNRPYYREYEALRRATFRMVSFSKAIGLEGGAISGPREYVQSFEALSGTSLFTAAIQPPTAATIAYLIELLTSQPQQMDAYLAKVERWRARLVREGFRLFPTNAYIMSVFLGKDQVAEQVRRFLYEKGYLVPVFRFPAVKRNQALMRLIMHNLHTENECENFLEALLEARRLFRF